MSQKSSVFKITMFKNSWLILLQIDKQYHSIMKLLGKLTDNQLRNIKRMFSHIQVIVLLSSQFSP